VLQRFSKYHYSNTTLTYSLTEKHFVPGGDFEASSDSFYGLLEPNLDGDPPTGLKKLYKEQGATDLVKIQ
jgi:hypothetical protein